MLRPLVCASGHPSVESHPPSRKISLKHSFPPVAPQHGVLQWPISRRTSSRLLHLERLAPIHLKTLAARSADLHESPQQPMCHSPSTNTPSLPASALAEFPPSLRTPRQESTGSPNLSQASWLFCRIREHSVQHFKSPETYIHKSEGLESNRELVGKMTDHQAVSTPNGQQLYIDTHPDSFR